MLAYTYLLNIEFYNRKNSLYLWVIINKEHNATLFFSCYIRTFSDRDCLSKQGLSARPSVCSVRPSAHQFEW